MSLVAVRRLLSGPAWTILGIAVGVVIPVLGVAFLGWDAAQILMLYWAENLVVGVLTLPRILAARGDRNAPPDQSMGSAAGTGCFFSFHYGVFCFGHLIFASMLASDFIRADGAGGDLWTRTFGDPGFGWAVLGLAVVHLVSQIRDWWMVRAWRDASPTLEMFRPYGRIAVLHVTVLCGAWLMLTFNAPAWVVLLLCVGKAALELVGAVLTGRLSLRRP